MKVVLIKWYPSMQCELKYNIYHYFSVLHSGEGGGGYFTKFVSDNKLNLSFCKEEGSKRSKINEKRGQLDRKSRR